jgi:hypothetical protein
MQRRDVLKALGAATLLTVLPEHEALAAWARLASNPGSASTLTGAQLALVGAIADTILPRTDTPSATDVGVPAFIDVIVGENFGDAQRASFLSGLDALEAGLRAPDGTAFVAMDVDHRAVAVGAIEQLERRQEPAPTYWRLKGLVLHGYFTSEPVMKKVLKYEMMPGRYDGAARVLGS